MYRTRYNKKTRSARSKYYRYARRGISTARQIAGLARDVYGLRQMVNTEYKYVDHVATITPSTTATLLALNDMSQGDTGTTRDGQSILMKSVYLQFTSTINASGVATYLRCMIFIDAQPNSSIATAATLLLNPTDVTSPLLLGSGNRYRVIYDSRITLTAAGSQGAMRKFYKKLNFHTKYNTGNAGTIADIVTNSLVLLFMSNESTNTPSVSYSARVRFIDN